jgi:hypothetical protein
MRNQIADALEHGTMASKTGESAEVLGHDDDRKVPPACFAPRVTGVRRTVVLYLEHCRGKLGKPALELRGDRSFHGVGSDT